MQYEEWIDFETLKTISWHTTGIIGALLSFILVGFIIKLGIDDGIVKTILEWMENFALLGLVAWLIIQTAQVLWARRVKHGSSLCLLVA
jgi:hypothetical protein